MKAKANFPPDSVAWSKPGLRIRPKSVCLEPKTQPVGFEIPGAERGETGEE